MAWSGRDRGRLFLRLKKTREIIRNNPCTTHANDKGELTFEAGFFEPARDAGFFDGGFTLPALEAGLVEAALEGGLLAALEGGLDTGLDAAAFEAGLEALDAGLA